MAARDKAEGFIEALGGADNIKDIEGCITRLRGTLEDPNKIDKRKLRQLGATGQPIVRGNGIQVVVGTHAELIGTEMNKILKSRG